MSYAVARPRRLVLADLIPGARVRDIALIAVGAGLTGAAAQVSIHTSLSPVPFTLQTLAVLVVGASLGTVRGLLSIGLYAVAGVAGVPWYADHHHGWGGPSFGYIVGFVVAAGIVGELARRGNSRSVTGTVGLMAMGTAVIYLVGAVWLANDLHLSASKAVELGVTPFLVTDAIKMAVAALVLPAAWKLARR
ncbi:biotin transporter BioY [uncultured Jatrophihabitans sp.]|uniref:biotin transporter BioY n=1 Tax=uncultured Jatrophihabitans sp. TaxID=1610747 RepID=UPI0035CA5765